ncbi:MAG: dihydroorotase [Candidatus Peribacteraceae bacterium]|jgi:dihydroorotase
MIPEMNTAVLPGLIDMHVHLREPGLTHKGDMETETRAALAGGITTVCDMPNAVPPTVTVAALEEKAERAARIKDVDIRFYFGVTAKEHLEELWKLCTDPALMRLRMRCCGVKLFLDHSTGNQKIDPALAEEVLTYCAEQGMVAVCHCEDAEINAAAAKACVGEEGVEAHSMMRPPESEEAAVRFLLALSRKTGAHVHPTHVSTAAALALIREAKEEKVRVTCDVAPHHLFLTADDYPSLGTLGKMNPPLRTAEDQAALWEGIADGTVDCIATDHAPHTLEEKKNPDPLQAPSGVPGVETMLPLLLTVAAGNWPGYNLQPTPYNLSLDDIRRLCFENPNRILSLGKSDASALTINTDEEWVIRGKELHSKCGWTPYEGWKVRGKVMG